MKNFIVCLFLLVAGMSNAQVGINTTLPRATFDVVGVPTDVTKADGLIAPRITLPQLILKTGYGAAQTGTLIYVTDATGPTTTPTAQIKSVGYYYFDGLVWQSWALKSGTALFTGSLGIGQGTQINDVILASDFITVKLAEVKNVGDGIWNTTNNTYEVPTSGTYLIKSTVRLTDGSSPRSLFQAVHTSNIDIPDAIWTVNPTPLGQGRFTMLYTRIAYFNKGDLLRLYIYSDGVVANLSDASLNIAFLSEN